MSFAGDRWWGHAPLVDVSPEPPPMDSDHTDRCDREADGYYDHDLDEVTR